MKSKLAILAVVIFMPFAALAEEETKKGFWASLVPDNNTVVETGKTIFGQIFRDTRDTGKVILEGGKSVITSTGEKIKDLAGGE